jgi:hypothetical protein
VRSRRHGAHEQNFQMTAGSDHDYRLAPYGPVGYAPVARAPAAHDVRLLWHSRAHQYWARRHGRLPTAAQTIAWAPTV